jgi:Tol biopolymer transport system component
LADRYGSVSVDGKYMTFMDTTGDLGLLDLATGQQRRLTKLPEGSKEEFAEYSVFSPDGSQIAYGWQNKEGRYDLRVIRRDGGEPRLLYANAQINWLMPYGWSPDGRDILAVVATDGHTRQLVLVSAATGSVRVLRTFEWLMAFPERAEYSPDGRFIVFDHKVVEDGRSDRANVYVMPADASHEIMLFDDASTLGWVPDGKSVLVSSSRGGTRGVWAVSVENGRPTGQPRRLMDLESITVTGFTQQGDLYYFQRGDVPQIYLTTIDPGTGRVTQPPVLLRGSQGALHRHVVWSPDGERLAYNIGGPTRIGIQDVRTGVVRIVPVGMSYLTNMLWSFDGSALIAAGLNSEARAGAFRIDLSTGRPEPLTLDNRGPLVGVSADGKELFRRRFLDEPKNGQAIALFDMTTGRERELFRDGNLRDAILSPDGRLFALRMPTGSERILQIMPVSGGDRRTILRDPVATRWGGFAWASDSRSILLSRGGELTRIPIDGGGPQALGVKMNIEMIAPNPDGRRVAFISGGDAKNEVRVLENMIGALRASTK